MATPASDVDRKILIIILNTELAFKVFQNYRNWVAPSMHQSFKLGSLLHPFKHFAS